MKRGTLWPWLSVLAVIVTIAVNGLANVLPLNGQTTGAISDRFPVYFVPAGYVFSIWGLIYLGLIAFAVYQVLPAQRENPRLRRIEALFPLSCLANIVWLFLWHYEVFLGTIVAMLALLGLLIAIYLRLEIGRGQVSRAENWWVRLPFSVYLGWVTVATIANVTSVLDYIEWSGWGIGPAWWAVIMLVAATVIASLVSLTRGDVAYMLVIIWAFTGIAVKHADTPTVAVAAALMVLVVAGVMAVGAKRRPERPAPVEGQQEKEAGAEAPGAQPAPPEEQR
jgi:hypothetical protein